MAGACISTIKKVLVYEAWQLRLETAVDVGIQCSRFTSCESKWTRNEEPKQPTRNEELRQGKNNMDPEEEERRNLSRGERADGPGERDRRNHSLGKMVKWEEWGTQNEEPKRRLRNEEPKQGMRNADPEGDVPRKDVIKKKKEVVIGNLPDKEIRRLEDAIIKESNHKMKLKKKNKELQEMLEQEFCVIQKKERDKVIKRVKNILEKEKKSKDKLKERYEELEQMVIEKFGDDRKKRDLERRNYNEYRGRKYREERFQRNQ